MQQWTAEGQTQGLRVNYTPHGLARRAQPLPRRSGRLRRHRGRVRLAGGSGDVPRGYQYVPDVGGAIAVMYNVRRPEPGARSTTSTSPARRSPASSWATSPTWSDPAIAADNTPANLRLPDEPINVVYRSGQSGTTGAVLRLHPGDRARALRPVDRSEPPPAADASSSSTARRASPRGPRPCPAPSRWPSSWPAAQGRWSIAYDEFGYAKTYGATSAWVDNSGGKWMLPYAENISAALESASLRPDLSQELSGVYRSANPLTYPISAYSYLVTQCQAGRDTCRGAYSNAGVAGTLAKWMRYIACERPGPDGPDRVLAPAAEPLPGDRQLDRPDDRGRAPSGSRRGTARTPASAAASGRVRQSPPDPYEGLPSNPGGPGRRWPGRCGRRRRRGRRRSCRWCGWRSRRRRGRRGQRRRRRWGCRGRGVRRRRSRCRRRGGCGRYRRCRRRARSRSVAPAGSPRSAVARVSGVTPALRRTAARVRATPGGHSRSCCW